METDIIQFLMFLMRVGGGVGWGVAAYIFSSATIATLDIVSTVFKKASRHGDTNHPGCVTDHVSSPSMHPHLERTLGILGIYLIIPKLH